MSRSVARDVPPQFPEAHANLIGPTAPFRHAHRAEGVVPAVPIVPVARTLPFTSTDDSVFFSSSQDSLPKYQHAHGSVFHGHAVSPSRPPPSTSLSQMPSSVHNRPLVPSDFHIATQQTNRIQDTFNHPHAAQAPYRNGIPYAPFNLTDSSQSQGSFATQQKPFIRSIHSVPHPSAVPSSFSFQGDDQSGHQGCIRYYPEWPLATSNGYPSLTNPKDQVVSQNFGLDLSRRLSQLSHGLQSPPPPPLSTPLAEDLQNTSSHEMQISDDSSASRSNPSHFGQANWCPSSESANRSSCFQSMWSHDISDTFISHAYNIPYPKQNQKFDPKDDMILSLSSHLTDELPATKNGTDTQTYSSSFGEQSVFTDPDQDSDRNAFPSSLRNSGDSTRSDRSMDSSSSASVSFSQQDAPLNFPVSDIWRFTRPAGDASKFSADQTPILTTCHVSTQEITPPPKVVRKTNTIFGSSPPCSQGVQNNIPTVHRHQDMDPSTMFHSSRPACHQFSHQSAQPDISSVAHAFNVIHLDSPFHSSKGSHNRNDTMHTPRADPPRNDHGRTKLRYQDPSNNYHNFPVTTNTPVKQEALEQSRSKDLHKEYLRMLREKDKEPFPVLLATFQSKLETIPPERRSKIILGLADAAKRENLTTDARRLFNYSISLDPTAFQPWLEWYKMEEECGSLACCEEIIENGLKRTNYHENLISKYIKHHERLGNIDKIRNIMSISIKQNSKCYKIILEAAWMEARLGNEEKARDMFQYLMTQAPNNGHIFQESSRFEERCGDDLSAYIRAWVGVQNTPKHPPLWLHIFRLNERLQHKGLDTPHSLWDLVIQSRPFMKDTLWKVYYEYALALERMGKLAGFPNSLSARAALSKASISCPARQRWKIWSAGSRIESICGNITAANLLIHRALEEVPPKMKSLVMVDYARIEEYSFNFDNATQILAEARLCVKQEWKVFLESIMFEVRKSDIKGAIACAQESLQIHSGTGRLWAIMIQLKIYEGEDAQLETFYTAIRKVPKSGEVWCEGARIVLNPLSKYFNLRLAKKFLEYAVHFTPQYGDSFVELLRFDYLSRGVNVSTPEVDQLCINADPNYGTMWFFCKNKPLDNTKEILEASRALVLDDICSHSTIYQHAILHLDSKCDNFQACDPLSLLEVRESALELGVEPWMFCTGIVKLNRMYRSSAKLTEEDRKKLIFGSEAGSP